MVWEAVFMLVLLKIPIVYLCMVVWWAIRAEPREEGPAVRAPVTDTPSEPTEWTRASRPARRGGPDRAPRGREPRRPAPLRGEARR
jgi:hypothetical protein